MQSSSIKLLPGWQNSGPGHWQTVWEEEFGYERVQQHDWMHPKRGDWTARLQDVIVDAQEPVVLVAPGDVERPDLAELIPGWSPIALQKLPFPSILVGSQNDPYCSAERARLLADSWGARWVDQGDCGHINAESGLGNWPLGQGLLAELSAVAAAKN